MHPITALSDKILTLSPQSEAQFEQELLPWATGILVIFLLGINIFVIFWFIIVSETGQWPILILQLALHQNGIEFCQQLNASYMDIRHRMLSTRQDTQAGRQTHAGTDRHIQNRL